MSLKRLGALAAVAATVWLPGVALAQTPAPYPPGTNARCVQTFNEQDQPDRTFRAGDPIGIVGDPGCAASNELNVEFFFASDPVIIARKNAAADGSYSVETRIPSNATPGRHRIIVRTKAATYEQPITILGAAGGARGASRLPRTGADIALLAAWGVSVLLFGSLLMVATWKRYRLAKTEASFAPVAHGPQFLQRDDVTDFQSRRPIMVDTSYVDDSEPIAMTSAAVIEAPVIEVPTYEAPVFEADPFVEPELDVEPEPEPVADEPTKLAPRASSETSELIGRLEQEIAAWSKK